jgi:4,5-DOPA dioxygenase extradiol
MNSILRLYHNTVHYSTYTKEKIILLQKREEIGNSIGKNKIQKMALKETFYISHGSPTLAIDETIPAWKFLTSWKEVFPHKPSAILVISGHWDTSVPTVNVVNKNETIHDFGGFPRSMYKVCFSFLLFCLYYVTCQ